MVGSSAVRVPEVARDSVGGAGEKAAKKSYNYNVCFGPGASRVISDCHFAVQLNHIIPGSLSYSVAFFLK
jgi:hypothetical protein